MDFTNNERLIEIRKKTKFSARIFAALIGFSRSAIYDWEAKRREAPLEAVIKAGEALEKINEIIENTEKILQKSIKK